MPSPFAPPPNTFQKSLMVSTFVLLILALVLNERLLSLIVMGAAFSGGMTLFVIDQVRAHREFRKFVDGLSQKEKAK